MNGKRRKSRPGRDRDGAGRTGGRVGKARDEEGTMGDSVTRPTGDSVTRPTGDGVTRPEGEAAPGKSATGTIAFFEVNTGSSAIYLESDDTLPPGGRFSLPADHPNYRVLMSSVMLALSSSLTVRLITRATFDASTRNPELMAIEVFAAS